MLRFFRNGILISTIFIVAFLPKFPWFWDTAFGRKTTLPFSQHTMEKLTRQANETVGMKVTFASGSDHEIVNGTIEATYLGQGSVVRTESGKRVFLTSTSSLVGASRDHALQFAVVWSPMKMFFILTGFAFALILVLSTAVLAMFAPLFHAMSCMLKDVTASLLQAAGEFYDRHVQSLFERAGQAIRNLFSGKNKGA